MDSHYRTRVLVLFFGIQVCFAVYADMARATYLPIFSGKRKVPLTCTTPAIYTAYPSVNSALIAWDSIGTSTYLLDWRRAGTTTWPNSLTTSSHSIEITGLNGATAYEVRVKARCPDGSQSDYSTIAGFTTQTCQPPADLRETTIGPVTVDITWSKPYSVSTVLQWRTAGMTTWPNSVSLPATGANSTGYSFTGLTTGSAYEWRIKALCSPVDESVFTAPRSFTAQCSPPGLIYGADISSTASTVYWADILSYSYSVRWRVAGSNAAWTEGPAVTANFYTISGLTNATTYEWQVRMICNGTPTGWSVLTNFTTQCSTTYLYGITPSITSAVLSVATRPNVRYRIEWRVVGSSTWPNSYTTTESTALTITGLLPNTTYEARSTVLCADGNVSNPSDNNSFTTLPAADLSLAMTVNNRTPRVNERFVYAITITNSGPQDVYNVKAQSLLPPNMTFAGSAQVGVTSDNGAVAINVGAVGVGTSATFSFSAQATAPGIYRTAAQITEASLPDPDSYLNSGTADGDDDAATVDLRTRETGNTVYASPNPIFRVLPAVQPNQPAPDPAEADLSLRLQTDERTLAPGTPLSVSVLVANRGALGATGVVVQLTLPTGWQLAAGSSFTQTGQTINLPTTSVNVNQVGVTVVPLVVSGSGEQSIRALITAANQPDLDSSHSNAFGFGEDDEATAAVRVR